MNQESPTSSETQLPGAAHLSAGLAAGCLLLAILLPVAVTYYLSTTTTQEWAEKLGIATSLHQGGAAHLGFWRRAVVVVLGLLPVSLISFGLLRARGCFMAFARGEYFSPAAISGLRGFAVGAFFSSVASLLVPPLSSATLTVGAAGGSSSIRLSVGSNELLLMLFAGIVWQIAAVFAKAARLAEENAQFV